MKYIDEFRNKRIAEKILNEIKKIKIERVNLMEVCGTHTVAIFKSGIRNLFPKNINLISGPGCPVCVTSQSDIDQMISLVRNKNVIIATFGDMVKVPGTTSSLEKEHAKGSNIRIVYSASDALEIAKLKKDKKIIFLAVGFETTSPSVASVIEDAKKEKIDNFSIYCNHKLIPPAMKAILEAKELNLNGFICPGHVSTIIGSRAYEFIARDYRIPCVISGFEPTDILESILMLLRQISQKKAEVQIQYRRAVKPEGNKLAQRILKRVFEIDDADWRGLGIIKKSGYRLNKKYQEFDAKYKFKIKEKKSEEAKGCLCGQVLRGTRNPNQCKLFGKKCTPENPYGPCMVSSEGTCSAWYKYNQ
ncbi:MAG: hydrogenase formation protein HypD [Candidatus Omnitrophica bacterium]|nr:hydrogenase formation protein HypD [Candidatus Omnitrophota bacterium]